MAKTSINTEISTELNPFDHYNRYTFNGSVEICLRKALLLERGTFFVVSPKVELCHKLVGKKSENVLMKL